jgi:hypothetical protein
MFASNNDSFPELLTNNPALEVESSESMFSSWWVWLFIILLLGFLGFNIFTYLAKGEQGVNNILSPFWKYITSVFSYTPAAVAVSSSPVETDVATSVKETNDAQPSTASVSKMNPDTTDSPMHDNAQNNALNRAINISKHQELTKQDYVANDSYSKMEGGKAGWCYIGSEQGYRSCSQVGEADTCMSGNIFPTQDVCVNPSLRA